MRFEELVSLILSLDLGEPGVTAWPSPDNVRAVQNALGESLADEDFCLDCIELELGALIGARQRPGFPVNSPAFHTVPERGVFFRFFYWPPGAKAPPHEHTSWSVNAVFQHGVRVATFDWNAALAGRRLVRRSVFALGRGEGEVIVDNHIHAMWNPTNQLAASVHLYSAKDRPLLRSMVGPIAGLVDDATPRPWPSVPADFLRALGEWRQRLLLMQADLVSRFRSRRALELLERIYREGDALVRFVVSMIVKRLDSTRASALFEELIEVAPEFKERAALVTMGS